MTREFPTLRGRGVTVTEIPCPLCAAERRRTLSDEVPKLRKLSDGSDERLFCAGLHGFVTDEELR